MFNALLSVFTFVGSSIQNGWDGFYSNRSDYYLCAALQKLRDRIPPTIEPRNHLLQRALRKSHLEASLLLCNSRLKELQPSGWRKFLANCLKPDASNISGLSLWADKIAEHFSPADEKDKAEFLWLSAVISALNTERNDIDKSHNPIEISKEIELFLQPQNNAKVKDRVKEMRKQVQDNLLKEFQYLGSNAGKLPAIVSGKLNNIPIRVREMIEEGWIPFDYEQSPLPLDEDSRLYWFGCFCGFFQQKLTGDIADVFQNRLLVDIKIGEGSQPKSLYSAFKIKRLSLKILKNELKRSSNAITERLAAIEKSIQESGEFRNEVRDNINKLFPLILLAENIEQTVSDLYQISTAIYQKVIHLEEEIKMLRKQNGELLGKVESFGEQFETLIKLLQGKKYKKGGRRLHARFNSMLIGSYIPHLYTEFGGLYKRYFEKTKLKKLLNETTYDILSYEKSLPDFGIGSRVIIEKLPEKLTLAFDYLPVTDHYSDYSDMPDFYIERLSDNKKTYPTKAFKQVEFDQQILSEFNKFLEHFIISLNKKKQEGFFSVPILNSNTIIHIKFDEKIEETLAQLQDEFGKIGKLKFYRAIAYAETGDKNSAITSMTAALQIFEEIKLAGIQVFSNYLEKLKKIDSTP